jgi:hypothetical protein
MARKRPSLTMYEPEEDSPLNWAASGCGQVYTTGQKRYPYTSRKGLNVESPRSVNPVVQPPSRNPFKVRGAK